jgi:hypothetical protein
VGLFSKTPKEIAEQEARRREADEHHRAEEFAKTPQGQARAARAAGSRIFQLALPLSQASALDLIEAEGWRLEHAGYVYWVTGGVSRSMFLSSGQEEVVEGEILGIYIFRLTEAANPSD